MTSPTPQADDWLDLVPLPAARLDDEGRLLACNRALADYLGLPLEQVCARGLASFLSEGTVAELRRLFVGPLASHLGQCVVRRHDRPSERVAFNLSRQPGRALFVLRTSHEPLAGPLDHHPTQEVLAHAGIGLVATSSDGRLVEVNDAFCRLLGASAPYLLTRTVRDISSPLDAAAEAVGFRALLQGKVSSYQVQKRFIRPDGSLLWTHVTVTPLLGPDGTIHRFVGAVVDISELKRAEARAEESAELLRKVEEVAGLGGMVHDHASGACRWTAQVYALLQLERTVAPAFATFLERVHPDDRERFQRAAQEPPSTASLAVEYRVLLPDGRVRWMHSWFRQTRAAEGTPLLSLGTVQDVTRTRQLELELRASVAEKETLLREVHHRVKNNLQLVSSMLGLQAGDAGDTRFTELVTEAQQRIRTVAQVHEQLYRSGAFAAIDLGQHVREVATAAHHAGARAGVELSLDVEPALTGLEVAIPVGLLLNELVSNAYKHAFPGGRPGHLAVSCRQQGQTLRVRVVDDGVGMAPFAEDEAPTLGVRLVRTLVRQLHATLTMEQQGGTALDLTVPLPAQAPVAGV